MNIKQFPFCFLSDYSGPDNPNSFYGEFSICSDGPTNLNQYEKIGKICFQ
jgi:hypothetical protein